MGLDVDPNNLSVCLFMLYIAIIIAIQIIVAIIIMCLFLPIFWSELCPARQKLWIFDCGSVSATVSCTW